MNKKSNAVILAIILLSSFMIASSLVKAQENGPTNANATIDDLKKQLDAAYLKELGIYNHIVAFNSSINLVGNSTSSGFTYLASFWNSTSQYFVQSSLLQVNAANKVTTTGHQTIVGALNLSADYEEINQTLSNSVSSTIKFAVQSTSTSGTYSYGINGTLSTALITSKLLNCNLQIYQNLIGLPGIYNVNIASQADNNFTVAFTQPNGTQSIVTTTKSPFDSESTQNVNGNNFSPMDDVPGYGWDFDAAYSGNYEVHVQYIWWSPGFGWEANVIVSAALAVIGLMFGGCTFVALVAIALIELEAQIIIGEAGAFPAMMGDYQETIFYSEVEMYDATINIFGFQITIPIPYEIELGYYSNIFCFADYNGGQPTYINPQDPNQFEYFDLVDTCIGQVYAETAVFGPSDSHFGIWPVDPPAVYDVTMLAYDESSNTYISGIPILLDDVWVPSSYSVSIPCGPYEPLFQGSDDGNGAFDCFFDGTNYYSNNSTIPLSGDTTIIAYYHYTPYAWLTIDYMDYYDNDLGSSSSYLPFGFYPIYTGGVVWDPYLNENLIVEGQGWLQVLTGDTYLTLYCGEA